MNFAFYDEIGGHSLGGALLRPYRRMLRFMLRPMLFKLRDLLQFLFDKHLEDRQDIEALRAELAALRVQVAAFKPVAVESAGVARRLAVVEDAVLKTLTERAA